MLAAPCALAGPPLETDDPDTPGNGNWEVTLAAEWEKSGTERETTPLADINYGVGSRVQLKLKPRAVINETPGRGTRTGAGNIQLGVKWRFFEDELHERALSIYPQIDLNPPGRSAERGLIDDGMALFLPIELALPIGVGRLHAEMGFTWRELDDDFWVIGLATEQSLSSSLRLVGELRYLSLAGAGEHELTARSGVKWKWSERWTLLVSVGRSLNELEDERPSTTAYIGLQQVLQ